MQQQDCHVAFCNDPSTPSDLIQCRLNAYGITLLVSLELRAQIGLYKNTLYLK